MASAEMVVYCFDALRAHFSGGEAPVARFDEDAK